MGTTPTAPRRRPRSGDPASEILTSGPLPRAWRERTDWVPVDTTLGQGLRYLRWAATLAFLVVLVHEWQANGVPFARLDLVIWIAIGLACTCIGRHPVWLLWVVIDFLPFAAV